MPGLEQARLLTTCDDFSFSDPNQLAQIIQGSCFIALAIILIFANNARVSVAQRATLEMRYGLCCTISTAVCLFSGFFNILQLTGLQKLPLPRPTPFTLDLARPIEWILTCPNMQLCLVILGGVRIPSYRRYMMPLLSVAVLLCGIASMFTSSGLRWAWYAFGFTLAMIMFYHNGVQISENSDGEESFLRGDSPFRRLSIMIVALWFPFPLWFLLSPEGIGLVTDETAVKMGWVVLNVVSKWPFVIYLQVVKNSLSTKIEATKALYKETEVVPGEALGTPKAPDGQLQYDAAGFPVVPVNAPVMGNYVQLQLQPERLLPGNIGPNSPELGEGGGPTIHGEKMHTLVSETMISLGLAGHTDRFWQLLVQSGITRTDILERLTEERCVDMNLPYSLVNAVQRRWKQEKMDLAEEQGENHQKNDPFAKLLNDNKRKLAEMAAVRAQMTAQGAATPMVAMDMRLQAIEDLLATLVTKAFQTHSRLESTEENIVGKVETIIDSVVQRMDFAQVTLLQSVNNSQVVLHKIDASQEAVVQRATQSHEMLQKVEAGHSSLMDFLDISQDTSKKLLLETVNESSEALLQKIMVSQEDLLGKASASNETLKEVVSHTSQLLQKADMGLEATTRNALEIEGRLKRNVEDAVGQVVTSISQTMEGVTRSLQDDVNSVTVKCARVTDVMEKSIAASEERMADVRRQNMMIMDTLSSTQEHAKYSAEAVDRMARSGSLGQSAASQGQAEIADQLTQLKQELLDSLVGPSGAASEESDGFKIRGALGTAVERIESCITTNSSAGALKEALREELSSMVGDTVRSELEGVANLQETVGTLAESMDAGFSRVEAGLEKVVSQPEKAREKAEKGEKELRSTEKEGREKEGREKEGREKEGREKEGGSRRKGGTGELRG